MVTKPNPEPLFRVPEQTLERLSYSEPEPEMMEAWVETLPKANLGETARLLYSGIQELNRLKIDSAERFELLEILRPAVYYLCNSLRKHYLNQPIVLPEKAAKVANLAQALQTHLATGYKIVVTNNANRSQFRVPRELISASIHRALSDMTATLIRCYQLYFPLPPNLWLDLNKLYSLAEDFKLTKSALIDGEAMYGLSSTIKEVYLRACILSTVKPNQLRQPELRQIYNISAYLVGHLALASNGAKGQPFVVNLRSGQGPIYRSIAKKIKNANNRYFECAHLVDHLKNLIDSTDTQKEVLIAKQLPSELLSHLESVWAEHRERTFARTEHRGVVQVGVGLSVVHYHLAGGVPFEESLEGDYGDNAFSGHINSAEHIGAGFTGLTNTCDALTEGGAEVPNTNFEPEAYSEDEVHHGRYELTECRLINTSAGGYSIELPNSIPGSIKTGELVIVREGAGLQWTLGVIRWAKRQSKESVRIGLEFVASQARPVGVKILHKTGDMGSYMRALILPELKALKQPMSVLVPNVSFQEDIKVLLNQHGQETKLQLLTMISKTASFSQFGIKVLTPNHSVGLFEQPMIKKNESKEDFDSIWTSL